MLKDNEIWLLGISRAVATRGELGQAGGGSYGKLEGESGREAVAANAEAVRKSAKPGLISNKANGPPSTGSLYRSTGAWAYK